MLICENEPMHSHTSLKAGGSARYFMEVNSVNDLQESFAFIQKENLNFFILGKGTNVLVADKGYNGAIIHLGNFFSRIEECSSGIFKAGASAALSLFSRKLLKNNYQGMHKLVGIPGSIGGAIFMNAGAYGQEIKDTCTSVESLDFDGNLHVRTNEECAFEYRSSIFQKLKKPEVIIAATFELSKGEADLLEKETKEILEKRKKSQPLKFPNAGSTFKRVENNSAGALIEQAGLKGFSIGGAQISTMHANFIVNTEHATATDIFQLVQIAEKKVFEKFGIALQREIIFLGQFE